MMMEMLISYGWHFMLAAILGEIAVPFLLAPFYKGYRHSTMAISSLGNSKSPVRIPFNLWMLLAGTLFLLSTSAVYSAYGGVSKPVTIAVIIFLSVFAVGACIFSCFFSVGETKQVATAASKIHGVGSAIGFMLLLFVPLLLAILSWKSDERPIAVLSSLSFGLALASFVLFIMADKPGMRPRVAKEGLWQRLILLFMYLPLAVIAVGQVFGGM